MNIVDALRIICRMEREYSTSGSGNSPIVEALQIAEGSLADKIGKPKPLLPCQRFVVEQKAKMRKEYPVTNEVVIETQFLCPITQRSATAARTLRMCVDGIGIDAYESEGALASICAECKYRKDGEWRE